eukprot:gene18719-64437_t
MWGSNSPVPADRISVAPPVPREKWLDFLIGAERECGAVKQAATDLLPEAVVTSARVFDAQRGRYTDEPLWSWAPVGGREDLQSASCFGGEPLANGFLNRERRNFTNSGRLKVTALANHADFKGPAGALPARFIGWADEVAGNYVDGEIVLPKGAQYPARLTVIGGGAGAMAARVREEAVRELQRKWLTPKIVADLGAVQLNGPGGHAGLPSGAYFIVDAWFFPAKGGVVTAENLLGFQRAAGMRSIVHRAIFSAASLPPLDPGTSFVVGFRAASDIGAAVCFPDFVEKSQRERGSRVAEVEARVPPAPPPPAPPPPAPAPSGGHKADVDDRRRAEDEARAAAQKAAADLQALIGAQSASGQGADASSRLLAAAVATQSAMMSVQIAAQGRLSDGVCQMGEAFATEARLKQQRDGGRSEQERQLRDRAKCDKLERFMLAGGYTFDKDALWDT